MYRLGPVLLYKPKYRLAHPEKYLFQYLTKSFLSQSIPHKKKMKTEALARSARIFVITFIIRKIHMFWVKAVLQILYLLLGVEKLTVSGVPLIENKYT